jgi:hypothetical protein
MYINELIQTKNTLCLQETWALNDKTIKDAINLTNKKIYTIAATKNLIKGRASGGLAFIVDSKLKCKAKTHSQNIVTRLRFTTTYKRLYETQWLKR